MTNDISNDHLNPVVEPEDFSDRRRHGRVDFVAKARVLDENGAENPALVINISAGGALLKSKEPPSIGEKVVLYIDNVGRFEGKVVRSSKHVFAVDYRSRKAKSKRTADVLMQAVNRPGSKIDRRAAPRIRQDAAAHITLDTGEIVECSILDISLTGAAIEIDPRPALGTVVTVGRMAARVVRRFETGVGVVFTGPAHRMDQVIEETTSRNEAPEVGADLAGSFGKKSTDALDIGTNSTVMLAADNWCIKVSEKVYGPYSSQQLRKFAREGRLAGWSLVAPAGSRDWREARNEKTFSQFFGGDAGPAEKSFGRRDEALEEEEEAPKNAKPAESLIQRSKNPNAARRPQPLASKKPQTDRAGPANFIVVFDVVSGAASRVEAAMLSLGPAYRVADNVWAVHCALTAIGVRNAIAPYLRARESIFVVDATNGRTSWQNYAPQAHAKISEIFSGANGLHQ